MKIKAIKKITNDGPRGLRTGFTKLDQRSDGLKKGEMTLIAGGHGIGTTSFCMSIIDKVTSEGKKAVYFACNQPKENIDRRLLALKTGLGKQLMNGSNLTEEEKELVQKAAKTELKKRKIIINDDRCPDVRRIADTMVIYDSYVDSDVLIIDGLQFITSESNYQSRREEIEAIVRELKSFTAMMDIPVIVTCDISDAVEMRNDHAPRIGDLRIYGDIGKLVDNVWLIHREECFNPDTDLKGIMDIEIVKPYDEPNEHVKLAFIPEYMKCAELIEA